MKLTSPPKLTLLFSHLAPKCSTHAHIVDRPTRRSGLVPCILLPHGLPRPALRCALWRQPDNRHAQRLILTCACAYKAGLCKNVRDLRKSGCVYGPETEELDVRVLSISDCLYLLSVFSLAESIAVMLCSSPCLLVVDIYSYTHVVVA
jgi:hypothetical protein